MRLPDTLHNLVKACVAKHYLVEPRPSLRVLFNIVRDEIWRHNRPLQPVDHLPVISKSTVYRMMRSIDHNTQVFCHSVMAEADHKQRMVEDGLDASRHNDCYEFDHTPADIIVVDERTGLAVGRLLITTAIDRATRMIVGYQVG